MSSERIEALAREVEQVVPGLARAAARADELACDVEPAHLLATARALCEAPALRFAMLVDLAGVDYLHYGIDDWQTNTATRTGFSRARVARPEKPDPTAPGRYGVTYHLLSIEHNQRLRLKVRIADSTDPVLDSVTPVWPAADWYEREAFDLFGIQFRGHPDLRRLLTDYGFVGHPFRKDFPLEGNVEVQYDPDEGRVVYRPVSIVPRVIVPKVIRHDNRYDPALKDPTTPR